MCAGRVTSVIPIDREYLIISILRPLPACSVCSPLYAPKNISFFYILRESGAAVQNLRMSVLALGIHNLHRLDADCERMALLTFLRSDILYLTRQTRRNIWRSLHYAEYCRKSRRDAHPFGNPQNLFSIRGLKYRILKFTAIMAPPFILSSYL